MTKKQDKNQIERIPGCKKVEGLEGEFIDWVMFQDRLIVCMTEGLYEVTKNTATKLVIK